MFKTAATKIAHNSTIPALAGNQDLRPLQDLITAEKAVIVSLQKLSIDFSKASEALRAWGLGEGDDLGNILGASTTILTHFSSAVSQYAAHGHTIREQLKAIRTREEHLDDLKRRRRSVMSKADSAEKKLSKMSPEHKNLPQQSELLTRLQEEIRGLDGEIMKEEAATGDFKRTTARSCLGLKFGGLLECCEKGVIAGEFGKLVVFEIPEEETAPGLPRSAYWGHAKVENHVAEAHRCVNEVRLSTVPSINQPSRRVEPQLPPVPTMSDSPIVRQRSISSPTQHADNGGVRRDPVSQGPGPGYLDSPGAVPPSPFHQQPQYYGSLSSASAAQSGASHRVDEFGSTGGPIEAPMTGGGRFATFPVKGRSGSVGASGGYQFRDDPSLPPVDYGPTGSFSSSVTQPFASERSPRDEPTSPFGNPGRFSRDGPAPAYVSNSGNPWTNQQQLPANDPRLLSTQNKETSKLSDDEALLAYMTTPLDHLTDHEEDPNVRRDKHVSRHVRFGEVQEFDAPPFPVPYQHQSPVDLPTHDRRPFDDRNNRVDEPVWPRDSSPTHVNYAPGSSYGPAPHLTREDEERALNAAAARGVALELQTSAASRTPSLSLTTPVPSGEALQQDISMGGYSREPVSPLLPPSASYMADRRSVSPRPEYTVAYAENTNTTIPSSPLTQQHTTTSPSPPMPHPVPADPPMPEPRSYNEGEVPLIKFGADHSQPYEQQSDSFQRYSTIQPQNQQEPYSHQEQGRQDQYTTSLAEPALPASQASPPLASHTPSPPAPQASSPLTPQTSSPLARQATLPQINLQPQYADLRGRSPFRQEPMQDDGLNDPTMTPSSQTPYQTPYQTPSENPPSPTGGGLGLGLAAGAGAGAGVGAGSGRGNSPYLRSPAGGLPANRSTSSINTTGSGGGGKISAAAFKRPQPRHGSGGGPPNPFSAMSGTMPGGGSGGEVKKTHSPFPSAGSRDEQYGLSQPKKRETQELDVGQYGYISAYVDGAGADGQGAGGIHRTDQAQGTANIGGEGGGGIEARQGREQQPTSPGGYAEGRFATNLENEGLR